MAHYYEDNRETAQQIKQINHVIAGRNMQFFTAKGVFSKDKVDFGSHFLVETILKENITGQQLLDIGCGYGAIGLTLAVFLESLNVTMLDINSSALQLAKHNIAQYSLNERVSAYHVDDYQDKAEYYDIVVTNPPIRAGKKTVFDIYKKACYNLKMGGYFYVVIQKKQGAPSSKKYLSELFGNCSIVAKRSGYYILKSRKY